MKAANQKSLSHPEEWDSQDEGFQAKKQEAEEEAYQSLFKKIPSMPFEETVNKKLAQEEAQAT